MAAMAEKVFDLQKFLGENHWFFRKDEVHSLFSFMIPCIPGWGPIPS